MICPKVREKFGDFALVYLRICALPLHPSTLALVVSLVFPCQSCLNPYYCRFVSVLSIPARVPYVRYVPTCWLSLLIIIINYNIFNDIYYCLIISNQYHQL